MTSKKRMVRHIAKNYRVDSDELLIALWDIKRDPDRFNYALNANSVIRAKDMRLVKSIIRELGVERDARRITTSIPTSVATDARRIPRLFDFSRIGRVVGRLNHITKEEVLKIYDELVEDFREYHDPISPAGIRDVALLESALFHPTTAFAGVSKYPTAQTAGAALMYAISSNHAFHNGNKRTAMVAMLVFLDRHGLMLTCSEDELFQIAIKLADHKLAEQGDEVGDSEIYRLARWIHSNSRILEGGERPITMRRLRQILSHFGCTIRENGIIERHMIYKRILGINRTKTISTHRPIFFGYPEGREVDQGLIRTIRRELELDDQHGVDSSVFYAQNNSPASEFIIKYKNLLKRLSKA